MADWAAEGGGVAVEEAQERRRQKRGRMRVRSLKKLLLRKKV